MTFVLEGRRLAAILGTDGDDEINVLCYFDPRLTKQKCDVTINHESRSFLSSTEIADKLLIDAGMGDDVIRFSVLSNMLRLDDVLIKPGAGINHVHTELQRPFSYAVVDFDPNSTNTLHFTEKGSNVFVIGFKENADNKIQIHAPKQDISVERTYPDKEEYGLYLSGHASPFLSMLNTLTLEQMQQCTETPGELIDYFNEHDVINFN